MKRIACVLAILGLGALAVFLSQERTTAEDVPPGVVGNGTTDNTAVLQRALQTRGGFHLPRGVYRITKPLVVDLTEVGRVQISGDSGATLLMDGPGPALQFVGSHEGTAAPKTQKPEIGNRERTPTVVGLEIVGKHADADAIEARGAMQLTVDRVVIRECRHGIHLVKRNRNVLITACHIYNNRGIGVFLDAVNLHQINIVGSHISYCQQGGVVSRGGEVRNLHIGTCDIEGNMAPDQRPTANVLLDCTEGSIAEVAITGCTIQHESPSPDSANIRILGQGVGGLKNVPGKTQEGHVTITGNVFSDVKVNVDIQHARGVSIVGNTFWMGYEYNLRVEHSQQIVVGPNDFQRNPRYDYGTAATTKNAILFRDCADCTLTGLHIHRVFGVPSAVLLERCDRINMTNCTILDCDATALHWKDVRRSRLSDCLIRNDLPDAKNVRPLVVEGGSDNVFQHNVLKGEPLIPKDHRSDGNVR